MSIFTPVNAAPMTIMYGIDDKSIKTRLPEAAPQSIHTPMIYTWAETGPTTAIKVFGNSIPLLFGDKTVDLRSKFATHTTPFLNLFLSNANPVVLKRLLPSDVGPKASLRISVEVLEEELDEYEREVDGSFKRDVNGDFVTTGAKVQGYLLKYSTDVVPVDPVLGSLFGKGTIKTGTLVNAAGQPSKVYPLMDLEAPHFGSYSNNFGIRLSAPTVKDNIPVRSNIIEKDHAYPFRLAYVRRMDENSAAKEIDTNYGEKFDEFVLKPDMIDTDYGKDRSIGGVFIDSYSGAGVQGTPPRYGPVGRISVYQENIDKLLKDIHTTESANDYQGNGTNELFGLDVANEEKQYFYRVNLFGLQQSDGSPYQTARFNDGVRFNDKTDFYLRGATDGTMTNAEFDKLVAAELESWADPNSPYQDMVEYPISAFWDTGFGLETKFKMGNFVARRKDNLVIIATHIDGEAPLTASEESARTMMLVERVRGFAESEYFNTKTVRATVVSRSSTLVDSIYKKRLPVSYELAEMTSLLAGGSAFKMAYLFDRPPQNTFKHMRDVNAPWVPALARNRDWAIGMMYPEKLESDTFYFAAARTVYKEDSSVLTSFINALIACEIQKVGVRCQRYHSGGLRTKNELKDSVESFMSESLSKRFGELVRIEPECIFTDGDNSRGYSWSLKVKVWFPMMRTVETLWIEAYDLDSIGSDSTAFLS